MRPVRDLMDVGWRRDWLEGIKIGISQIRRASFLTLELRMCATDSRTGQPREGHSAEVYRLWLVRRNRSILRPQPGPPFPSSLLRASDVLL